MRKAASWVAGSSAFTAIIQVAQMSVIARSGSFAELGVLGIVNVFVAIVAVLQDSGLSNFSIYQGELSRPQRSTLIWTAAALGVTGFLLTLALAPLMAAFFAMPALEQALPWVAINFIIIGLTTQQQAEVLKRKQVKQLALIEAVARVGSFGVALALVATNQGPIRAAVGALLTFSALKGTLLWLRTSGERLSLELDLRYAARALSYGSFYLGSQFLNQFRTQLDQIIVARWLGAEAIGVYSLAKEMIQQPLKLVTPISNKVFLPQFATIKSAPERLLSEGLRAAKFITLVAAGLALLMAMAGDLVATILYGADKGPEVASVFLLMLGFAILRPLGGVVAALAQATGQTRREFVWNVIACALVAAVYGIGVFVVPPPSFPLLLSVSQVVLTVSMYWFLLRPVVNVPWTRYIRVWLPAASAAAVLAYPGRIVFNSVWQWLQTTA